MPVTNAQIIDEALDHAEFLADTLAPDYRESGMDASAETVEDSARIIRDLVRRVKFGEGGA